MYELVPAANKAIDIVLDLLGKNRNLKSQQKAIKEHLVRELRFNIEIIGKLNSNENKGSLISPSEFRAQFNQLQTSALDSIKQAIPLSTILNERLTATTHSKNNTQFLRWCANDTNLHHLIERTYRRLEVAKSYVEFDGAKIDIGYMKFLMLSCIKALK